jgi:thiamine-phosphate pyrophosphorylase
MSVHADRDATRTSPPERVRHRLRGLYAITPDEPDTARLVALVQAALAGGVAALQYRNKPAPAALRREQVVALLPFARAARVPLIVNDDLGLALVAGADGVHLGATDQELVGARRQLPRDALLGASCYDRLSLAEAAAAAGADYVAFGSVFPSPTKPQAVRAPLTLFRAARAALALPIVAIGGITVENAHEPVAAGADMVAVITDVFDAADVTARARAYRELFGSRP